MRAGVGSEISKNYARLLTHPVVQNFFTPEQFITFGNLRECVRY